MPRFRKDTLSPGRYSVLTPDGRGRRVVTYTGADSRHLAQRFRDMKAAGLSVPGSWEHQDDAKPDTPEAIAQKLADKSRLFFGYVDESVLLSGDTLAFDFQVDDEADAKQIEKVRHVSPEIVTDWIDGSGHLWPGRSITHVAVTPRPVQANQQPFQRLSLNVVRLSLVDRLGDADMADDVAVDTAADTGADLETGGTFNVKDAMDGLAEHGIHLAPGTDESNFLQHLCVALHALANADKTDEVETTPAGDATPTPAPDSSPVMMSLQRRVENAEKRALNLERDDIDRRIKALRTTGRVAKPLADKLTASLKTERLSLTDDGTLASCKLLTQVEAFEQLDVGHTTDLLGNNRPQPVPDPEEEAKKPDDHVMTQLTGGRWTSASKNGK